MMRTQPSQPSPAQPQDLTMAYKKAEPVPGPGAARRFN